MAVEDAVIALGYYRPNQKLIALNRHRQLLSANGGLAKRFELVVTRFVERMMRSGKFHQRYDPSVHFAVLAIGHIPTLTRQSNRCMAWSEVKIHEFLRIWHLGPAFDDQR